VAIEAGTLSLNACFEGRFTDLVDASGCAIQHCQADQILSFQQRELLSSVTAISGMATTGLGERES